MKRYAIQRDRVIGWLLEGVHNTNKAIEVTEEQYLIAIKNSHNKINPDGTTEVFDFRTDEEKLLAEQSEFRTNRDKFLAEVDIEINKALDNNLDVTILRTYRQALRDATITWTLPSKPY